MKETKRRAKQWSEEEKALVNNDPDFQGVEETI